MRNKKIYVSMLTLTIIFLVAMYVLKIFFPQEFMFAIQNERIVMVGEFIDNHEVLYYILSAIPAFFTYYLYCCACSHRLKLKWFECLLILFTIILVRVVSFYDATMSSIISWTSFAFLPAIMKGDLRTVSIVFTSHAISQGLSISIRNLPMYLTNVNFITSFIFGFECYLWLILMYIIFNYKKEK